VETIIETEEERAERIQRWRLHRALGDAPDLLEYIRRVATSGQGERGEVLREWSAPMRISAVDDIDDVYERIIYWVKTAAEDLRLAPAATTLVAWALAQGDVKGFRAEATPEGVALLTRLQTSWLLVHEEQVQTWALYGTFRDDVLDMLWSLRARYPMDARRERSTTDRVCPACGEQAVSASWWSESMRDVDVSCAECGLVVEAKTKIIDALDWEVQESRDCTCAYPGDPLSTCPVHHPEGALPHDLVGLPVVPKLRDGGHIAPAPVPVVARGDANPASSFADVEFESDLRPGEVVCPSCFMVKPCPCEDGQ
jgi:Zn ribbon nucleic-acid-binding protein